MSSSASKRLILVTGASGFIGAQVVEHLLEAGYAVRGSSRSSKAVQLQQNCCHPDFSVVVVDDLVKGDLSEALKDVHGIVHAASPLPLPGHKDNFYHITVEGMLNLLRQAHAAGAYKFCMIGSISATDTTPKQRSDTSHLITEKDWSTVMKEDALNLDTTPSLRYRASKTVAERTAWEFVATHPEMDLTILLPPFVYGPLASTQVVSCAPSAEGTMLSTNTWIYMLLLAQSSSSYPRAVSPQCVDVRDLARAAVRALSIRAEVDAADGPGPAKPRGRRILLWGGSFTWTQAVRHIARVRPELRTRLLDRGEPPVREEEEAEVEAARVDLSQAAAVLGMREFIGWERMVEDTVDSLLEREAQWCRET